MQVEFNKAAQSLSEALLPTTKKAALSRLLKVSLGSSLVKYMHVRAVECTNWYCQVVLLQMT